MYCIQRLEVRVHIVFRIAVDGVLLVSRDVCDSDATADSIARVDALRHALRSERLKVATAIIPVTD